MTITKMTTMKQATATLRDHGMMLKRDGVEYRVSFKGARGAEAERCAYYATSLDDAVATGIDMRQQQDRIDAANEKGRSR